jgi:hypothetical protein
LGRSRAVVARATLGFDDVGRASDPVPDGPLAADMLYVYDASDQCGSRLQVNA